MTIKDIIIEDDIDFKKLIRPIFSNYSLFKKILIFSIFLGLFVSFFSKKEYQSNMIFSIDGPSKNFQGISGIAALTGFNLASLENDSQLTISDYPLIFNSIPYKSRLLELKFNVSYLDKKVSFEEFFNKHNKPSLVSTIKKYTIGIPGLLNDYKNRLIEKIKNKTQKSGPQNVENYNSIKLTKEQLELYSLIDKHLKIEVDEVSGNINLSSIFYDPLASAELLNNAYEVLKELVVEYKLKKARDEFKFLSQQLAERKNQFEEDEKNLNFFLDRNLNIKSNQFNSVYNSLKNKFDISFSFFNEISKQLEAQKIKLERENPNFTVFQPGYIPIKFSKPDRLYIMISYTIYGLILYVILVYLPIIKESFRNFIN